MKIVITRRQALGGLFLATTALYASPALTRIYNATLPWSPGQANRPFSGEGQSWLTSAERRCVEAIAERIIPGDESGAGAAEANVTEFIDRQLGGFYGRGDRWYMQGPFPEATDQQGYQSEYTPRELYRHAIAGLDAHCQQAFGDRLFADLTPEEQDGVLRQLESGEIDLPDVSGKTFFSLIRTNTIEGFFCDPLYGGNRNMTAWRLVGFPGARYDYRPYLDHGGKPLDLEPVSLLGREGWRPAD